MEEFAKLITALGTFAWPIVAVAGLYFLYPHFRDFMSRDKVKIKIGEMELSAEQATESISNQLKDLQNKVLELEQRFPSVAASSEIRDKEEKGLESDRQTTGRILWVDDHPSNNAIQVDKLRGDGWLVDLATNTAQALEQMEIREYDLVITDIGRTENGERRPTAGIQFAKEVRQRGGAIPIIAFTTHQALSKFEASAKSVGINFLTNSTVALYRQIDFLTKKKGNAN